jgi:hypothetical protein
VMIGYVALSCEAVWVQRLMNFSVGAFLLP